jgi:hypothetical protein
VVVFLDGPRTGLRGFALLAARLAAIAGLSAVSYRLVEQPFRRLTVPIRRMAVATGVALLGATSGVVAMTVGAKPPPSYFAATGQMLSIPGPAAVRTTEAVLVVGDSVAASLADGLLGAAAEQGRAVYAAPVSGCGLLPGATLADVSYEVYLPSLDCPSKVEPAVASALATADPEVVVWISVWDAEHREVDGEQLLVLAASDLAATRALVDARIAQFSARGARTVLVTNPPVGAPPPGDAVAAKDERLAVYNQLLEQIAAARADVDVIDLASYVCPSGAPCDDLRADGVRFRPQDGIHYDAESGALVAEWLLRELDRLSAGR